MLKNLTQSSIHHTRCIFSPKWNFRPLAPQGCPRRPLCSPLTTSNEDHKLSAFYLKTSKSNKKNLKQVQHFHFITRAARFLSFAQKRKMNPVSLSLSRMACSWIAWKTNQPPPTCALRKMTKSGPGFRPLCCWMPFTLNGRLLLMRKNGILHLRDEIRTEKVLN